MQNQNYFGRLSWLGAALAAQRNNLVALLLRIKGLVVSGGCTMLHGKFLKLMQQVAADQTKELDLIHEIEAVEKRHQILRKMRKLRVASPVKTKETQPLAEPEPIPPRQGLLKLLVLFYLFSAKPFNHKKQAPTVN